MGSLSDWETLKEASVLLNHFGQAHISQIISAHRSPSKMLEFAQTAESQGLKIIIAAAGGAAHLPGMLASSTSLPVIGVPVKSKALKGLDSLYSIVQMPAGVPVATMAIGVPGAKNAAIFALRILALNDSELNSKLKDYAHELLELVQTQNEELKSKLQ